MTVTFVSTIILLKHNIKRITAIRQQDKQTRKWKYKETREIFPNKYSQMIYGTNPKEAWESSPARKYVFPFSFFTRKNICSSNWLVTGFFSFIGVSCEILWDREYVFNYCTASIFQKWFARRRYNFQQWVARESSFHFPLLLLFLYSWWQSF